MARLRARPGGDSALRVAEVEAYRGKAEAAFTWLGRIRQRATVDENRFIWPPWDTKVRISPCLRPLRDDPRWEPMIAGPPERQPVGVSDGALTSAN